MKHINIFIGTMLLFFIFSCGSSERSNKSGRAVFVTILPQKYFVDRISGGRVKTLVLVAEGQNPHSYEPTPKQLKEMSEAAIWFLSGVDIENGLRDKISSLYKNLSIVDTTNGIKFRKMEAHKHDSNEQEEHHDSMNIDRHTWLGREPVLIMSKHIMENLIAIDPEGKAIYEENYKRFCDEVNELFKELKESLKDLKGKKVFVYHPAFGYFFDDFGIMQVAVEAGGKEPDARSLANLIALAKKEKPVAIFVQKQFPVTAADKIARSAGAEVVMLDPLSYEWIDNIRAMGNTLIKYSHKVK